MSKTPKVKVEAVEQLALTPTEAARAIGVTVGTLNNWRNRHQGPKFARLGTRVVYPVDELRRYLASNTVRA